MEEYEENREREQKITKEPPSMWKWYFGWHSRMLLTIPVFLLFVYQGIWFAIVTLRDVIIFFRYVQITWGAIFLVFILGGYLLMFLVAPAYICFCAIGWLYKVNIGENTAWGKFLYSIGISLLVFFGTSLIRMFNLWVMGLIR